VITERIAFSILTKLRFEKENRIFRWRSLCISFEVTAGLTAFLLQSSALKIKKPQNQKSKLYDLACFLIYP
jgi:hypothetical protein